MSITLFQDTNYNGHSIVLTDSAADLKDVDYPGTNTPVNDRTSSIIVTSGIWQVCQNTQFKGDSYILRSNGGPNSDGKYPNAGAWDGKNDSISSVRLVQP